MRPSAVPPIAKGKIVPPALEAQPQVSQQRQNFFCYPAHEDRKDCQLGLPYVPRTDPLPSTERGARKDPVVAVVPP
jgi:hypothetical protein